MKNKKNLLLVTILILIVFLVTGCSGLFTEPPKGIISGRVLIPPDARALSKDISGWVPAAGAEVTIVDASGVTHTVVTDTNGYFSFENIAVKANTIITAQVKVNGKTIILKTIIDRAVALDQSYNVGTLTPETTALALMVERLVKDGKEVDLEKIKKAKSFDNLVNEINDVLEEHGNVADDKDVKDLIDKIMEELFPKIVPSPPAPPAIIDVAFEKLEANGTSQTVTTTTLTITFDKKVDGLSVDYFTVEGASIIALHSVGPTYTLYIKDITVKDGETVKVKVAKSGYKFTPSSRDVQVWVKDIEVAFNGLIANGESKKYTTSALTITFDKKINDLSKTDFTVAGASIGGLSGTGPSYTLFIKDITVGNGDTVNVKVVKSGYKFTPASIDVQVWVQDIGIEVGGSSGGTSSTIHVPSYAKSGDLMILIFTIKSGEFPVKPDNWKFLCSYQSIEPGGLEFTRDIYYRKLTGSLSDISVLHSDAATSWILLRIPGGDTIEFSIDKSGNSMEPDPPSLSHGFGAGTKVVWIAIASLFHFNDSLYLESFPANLNDHTAGLCWQDVGCTYVAIEETTDLDSLDPDPFIFTPITPPPEWSATTLAVKRQ